MHSIDNWVNQISQDNSSLILVEGKRDVRALNKLGINNVNSIDKPIYSLIEHIARKNKDSRSKSKPKPIHNFTIFCYYIKFSNRFLKFIMRIYFMGS